MVLCGDHTGSSAGSNPGGGGIFSKCLKLVPILNRKGFGQPLNYIVIAL